MSSEHSIRDLCRFLEVSPSGYYGWCQRQAKPSPRTLENNSLKGQISSIYKESHQTYGSPRIRQELIKQGCSHGRNRIARLMRELGLAGRERSRFGIRTTDSKHQEPIAPNRLGELAPPTAPNQVWVGDITYIATEAGWLYLAGVMDLYSRRIVGWAMSERIDSDLVVAAWDMAQTHRQPPAKLLFHSDRGVQYASKDYRLVLQSFQAVASMSRKACCYDNAAMESFWSTLKLERIYRLHFATPEEAKREIFHYIETFYNPKRLHSSLGYHSPVDFENRNN
jgi:putative transposase